MVTESKPFASLSSGLLARKGAARPAMKPQGFGQMGGGNLEDLGWNDMGFEPPKAVEATRDAAHDAFGDDVGNHPRVHPTGLTPVASPVHSQHAEIEDRLASEETEETVETVEAAETVEEFDETEEAEEALDETAELYEAEPNEAEAGPAPVAVLAPVLSAVPMPAVKRAPTPRSAPGSKAKAAFTLRLDPPRHLKLRLACAVDGRSAQQIVTDALDRLLADMPELDAMAIKAKRKG